HRPPTSPLFPYTPLFRSNELLAIYRSLRRRQPLYRYRDRCRAPRDATQWPNAKRRALYVGAAPGAAGLSGLVYDALRRIDRGSAHQAADTRREAETDRARDVSEAFDAIVIGAGAAGLMCALTAGQRGRKLLLLEHLDKV